MLDWKAYKIARNNCTKLLREKKVSYFKNIFDKNLKDKNVKGTYALAKNIMGWSPATQPRMFLVEGIVLRKPLELANALQNYYKTKIDKIVEGLEKRGRDPLRFLKAALIRWRGGGVKINPFQLRQITESETLQYVQKLGNSTAFGQDGLDGLTLKVAICHLIKPITHIVNTSIQTKRFASKWKLSRLIPILKSKEISRLSPSSYRPIALLPVLSKIVERTIQIQLQDHLEKNQLLNSNGHAYRRELSTSTAIMQLTERLYEATDANLISQMLALDQSAAFDCVSHPILLEKLKLYGCTDDTITWMQSYLGHRTQYTSIGSKNSNMVAVDRGVPQGSILGPLLYLLFTNEASEVIRNDNCNDESHLNNTKLFGQNCKLCGEIVMYADDITYLIASKHRNRNRNKINENLDKLKTFLNDNELMLNVGKTHLLELMIKQKRGRLQGPPPQIEVTTETGAKKTIYDKKELRILGVNFQHNLGWKAHMETGHKATLPALRKIFGSIKQLSKMLPQDSRKLLVEGLLISKLPYAISQWGELAPLC